MLHISVGRVSKAFLLLACRVEFDEVARDVLHLIFGALLESFPSTASQPCDGRFRALTTFVLAYSVQVMNADEDICAVAVVEFNHLLWLAVHRHCHETSELRDAMVGVYDVVAYLQLVYLAQRDDGLSASCVLAGHRHAVETLENLMVRVAANLQPLVHKPFMQGRIYSDKRDAGFLGFKDRFQAIELLLLLGEDIDFVAIFDVLAQVVREDVELLVEHRLRLRLESNLAMRCEGAFLREF